MDGWIDHLIHLLLMILGKGVAPLAVVVLVEKTGDGREGDLAVAHNSHIRLYALVDLGVVDIEMYNLCLLCVGGWRTSVAIAESHTDGDDDISLLSLDVGGIVAMHTDHTHIEGMVGGQGRKTEQSACGRDVCLLDKLHQLVLCTAKFHTVTHQCQRTLGRVDKFSRNLNSRLLWSGIRHIAAHEIHLSRFPFRLIHLCVLGEVEHHRTWTAGACDIESTTHCPCNILGTTYLIAPLADRLCNTHEVNLLEGIGAKHSHAHLSCYHHDRRRVHHGVCNSGKCVCCTRSTGHDTHSHFITHPCITLGSMCGSLLVANEDMVECLFLATGIVI